MNKITISIDITIPQGMTQAEVVRLFTDHHGYQVNIYKTETGQSVPNPQTRAQFAKHLLVDEIGLVAANKQTTK